MIEIDGSSKSGSGTILRVSIALAAVTGQALHIRNIRQSRPQPGLKTQHLESVLAAAKLCDAELEGARIDSRELWFRPRKIRGGEIETAIGTAGSIPMLLMTVLPICVFAEKPVKLHVSRGGTDVPHSPTINYLRFVLLPILQRMGLNAVLTVEKYGYYPKGLGEATLNVEPCRSLKPLCLEGFGSLRIVEGASVCTFLEDRRVAERQARAAKEFLKQRSLEADIQVINDKSNLLQKGSSLVLWTNTDLGAILGADAIGELRKKSESVGEEAAEKLWKEISSRSTADINLADMLIPYVALAEGVSVFFSRAISDHLEANIWLAEEMLNAKFSVQKVGPLFKIEKHGTGLQ